METNWEDIFKKGDKISEYVIRNFVKQAIKTTTSSKTKWVELGK